MIKGADKTVSDEELAEVATLLRRHRRFAPAQHPDGVGSKANRARRPQGLPAPAGRGGFGGLDRRRDHRSRLRRPCATRARGTPAGRPTA